jgi:hypothetical protein
MNASELVAFVCRPSSMMLAAVINENVGDEIELATQQDIETQHVTQAIPISIDEEPSFEDELAAKPQRNTDLEDLVIYKG